jgi:hypothetical protein
MELLFNDLKALVDLLLISTGAIATQEEFHYIRWDRILPRILPN